MLCKSTFLFIIEMVHLIDIMSPAGAGMYSDATSPSTLAYPSDRLNPSRGQSKGDGSSFQAGCLQFGTHGSGGNFQINEDQIIANHPLKQMRNK